MTQRTPPWLYGTDHKDWLFDGQRCTAEQWGALDWTKAYVDLGPSPAGNLGPYWHVPHKDGDTVHRLYPKLVKTKWLNVTRQAAIEHAARAVTASQQKPRGNKMVRWDNLSGNKRKHTKPEQPPKRPMKCDGCGKNWADWPSDLCVGCQAYQDHQR